MTNEQIAEKIFNSYFEITGTRDIDEAKKHANALIDAQIQLMFQDEGTLIVDVKRELYLDDWENIKYIINKEL